MRVTDFSLLPVKQFVCDNNVKVTGNLGLRLVLFCK